MSKVLIISPDAVPVDDTLVAGPGIRYWEFARGLSRKGHQVTLGVPQECFVPAKDLDFVVRPWQRERIGEICEDMECVILPQMNSNFSSYYNRQVRKDIPTVVDVYDPVLIESLSFRSPDDNGVKLSADFLGGVVPLIKRGDFFLCANQRQKYYYLGILNVLGRINPLTFRSEMLSIIPFGAPSEEPRHVKQVLKGEIIGKDDLVVLWFSGIYPWFDAVTLVRAMAKVIVEIPTAKLVIMGGTHPRLHAPADEYQRTIEEAQKLKLLNKAIFLTEWRPYHERANWYLEADLAVCTYKDTLETLLSHRTRVIDFLWAGLPVITSRGDEVGGLIERWGCGKTVRVGDSDQLAQTIVEILKDGQARAQMSKIARQLVAKQFTWDRVLEPLEAFCRRPRVAPDRANAFARQTILTTIGTNKSGKSKVLGLAKLFRAGKPD